MDTKYRLPLYAFRRRLHVYSSVHSLMIQNIALRWRFSQVAYMCTGANAYADLFIKTAKS